jgi:hypothetical protein
MQFRFPGASFDGAGATPNSWQTEPIKVVKILPLGAKS